MKQQKSLPKRAAGNLPRVDTSLELKEILETVQTAAWLSGMNMEVIGDPGSGKTSILYFMARQTFGLFEQGGGFMKVECTPSTRAEKMVGHENPLYSLDPEAEQKGIPFWVFKNTPRDERVRHVLLNERSRLNEIAMDALLPVMDIELNTFDPVTFSADSNWLTNNPRHAALGDRFAMRVWYVNPVTDVRGVMSKRPISTWEFNVPTSKQIIEARDRLAWWRNDAPNTQAYASILDAIDSIAEAIPGTPFIINNRRVVQWMCILYSMGSYYAGSDDFDELPPEAFEAWAYAYPTISPMESLEWRKIVMANQDPLAAKIANMESEAIKQWKSIYETIRRENRNPQQRQGMVQQQIGQLLAGYQEILDTEYHNDPRAVAAVNRLGQMYRRMWRGEDLE